MANFSNSIVTAVQAKLAPMAMNSLLAYLEAIDVLGGQVVNSSGVITIGGRSLTNQQYEMLYELIGGQLNT